MILRQADYFPSLALERAVIRGRRFVFDVDDAIWTRDASGGSSRLAFLKGSARKARFLAAAADHVLAGNAILAEWLSEHNENVTVVPSLVDTGRVAIRRHVDADELVLGWIGSASTARYLDGLEPVLADVARRLPGRTIRLLTLGGKPSRRVDGIEYEAIPWSEAAEVGVLARIDVGLMPLPDTAWTRGKCAYKAIQYMAAGVPVVADAVGVTGDVVGQAPGLVCDGLQDWVDALVAFSTEPARSRAGAAGRERAVADFSNERWVPTIAAIIRGEL
jgi:glycosyltransferase involved in cell wall biosynthesis